MLHVEEDESGFFVVNEQGDDVAVFNNREDAEKFISEQP